MLRRIALLLFLFTQGSAFAADGGPYVPREMDRGVLDSLLNAHAMLPDMEEERPENQRLVSSALALALGPFGAHRLYLGTTPKVAVFYGITFGGFGVLAVMDLAHLLFTRDLEPYRNNSKVFMWGARPAAEVTPP